MSVFVDTSALYALASTSDLHHVEAREQYEQLLSSEEQLITTSYVVTETLALAQGRRGLTVTQLIWDGIEAAMEIAWVDEHLHRSGWSRLIQTSSRRVSLVDCVSFELMSQRRIKVAFAFDPHFTDAGFSLYVATGE